MARIDWWGDKIYTYSTKEVLSNVKSTKKNGIKIKLDSHDLKYSKPKFSSQECIEKRKTYSISLFVKLSIIYKNHAIYRWGFKNSLYFNHLLNLILYWKMLLILKNRYIHMADIPCITKKGSFIINGNKRVISVIIKLKIS